MKQSDTSLFRRIIGLFGKKENTLDMILDDFVAQKTVTAPSSNTGGQPDHGSKLNRRSAEAYSVESLRQLRDCAGTEDRARRVTYDGSMKKWRLYVQLEPTRLWFLSVFVYDDGWFDEYCLDCEAAFDSHYCFRDEETLRSLLGDIGAQDKPLDEVLTDYIALHGGEKLLSVLRPLVTAEYHYD